MEKAKCATCSEYKNCQDSFTSWIFFIIGLVATLAIRVVTVLINLNPLYGKLAWYVGVGGFFLFFVYKFMVSQAQSRAIHQGSLVEKINRQEKLSPEDYSLIGAIFCGLDSQKEKINYIFIFALSALALLLAFYMDFLR